MCKPQLWLSSCQILKCQWWGNMLGAFRHTQSLVQHTSLWSQLLCSIYNTLRRMLPRFPLYSLVNIYTLRLARRRKKGKEEEEEERKKKTTKMMMMTTTDVTGLDQWHVQGTAEIKGLQRKCIKIFEGYCLSQTNDPRLKNIPAMEMCPETKGIYNLVHVNDAWKKQIIFLTLWASDTTMKRKLERL